MDNTLDDWETRDAKEWNRAEDAVQEVRDRDLVEYFEYLRARVALANSGGTP